MRPTFLVVDKPAGITSHDVVAMVRAVVGVRKVGHTGTLDPFATGVLPLALGGATRLIQYLDEDLKVYEATIGLGAATDTGDPTGEVVREQPVPELDEDQVRHVLDGFSGMRMQAPPRHSAVKIRGRPSYAYAREGVDVRAAPRPVRIDSIDLLSLGEQHLEVRIQCGRGTYARVLADEIAQELGTSGHLTQLRRTRSGPFAIDQALDIIALSQIVAGRDDWDKVLRPARGADRVKWNSRDEVRDGLERWKVRPIDALGHLPIAPVPPGLAARVGSGGTPPPPPAGVRAGDAYLVVDGDRVVAIAESAGDSGRLLRSFGG